MAIIADARRVVTRKILVVLNALLLRAELTQAPEWPGALPPSPDSIHSAGKDQALSSNSFEFS
jgi:hypothetical protein